MNKYIAKAIYRGLVATQKMPVYSLFKEFKKLENVSYDHLQKMQWKQTQNIIKHAVENCNYYKKLFFNLGAEPEDIKNLEDFQKIPVLNKNIIKNQDNEILFKSCRKKISQSRTSGSTGIPLTIYKDSISRASAYAAMYQGHSWHGVPIGAKEARLWAVPLTAIGRQKTFFLDFALNRFRQKKIQVTDEEFYIFYCDMLKKNPEYLMGYPSLIFSFAMYLKKNGIDGQKLNLVFIKYTAEQIFDYQKEIIENIFVCPCISEYGSTETGVISFECKRRNNHILSGANYVEFEGKNLDDESDLRKIIVTNLHNFAFPIIRYEIGDLTSYVSTSCDCGLPFPCMQKVVGRTHDVVLTNDGNKIHSSVFSYFVKDLLSRGISAEKLRFIQQTAGEILMEIDGEKPLTSDEMDLVKKIFSNFFTGKLDLLIKGSIDIQRDPSGKFRYFISQVGINNKVDKIV